jgi:methionyl-tRNA synthetase
MAKFLLCNSIPYVNANPHVGHALEFTQSDVIARFRKSLGDDVLLLSGGDENAIKNVQAAEKANQPIQEFIDEHTELFAELAKKLNIHFDVFQKGSSPQHYKASQKLWELCEKNGDIYKKSYEGLYCVGCELFYEKDELNENGECFEHPGKPLEKVSEENYFFKLSNYQKQITQLLESDEIKITPAFRKNEALAFLKQGLKDISISRSNARAKNWGVPVPGDDSQRMYVWFDALNIYQSGVGFASDEEKYKKWWPADLHVIGKGILRFHAIYWPAFLLSAKLQLPKAIFVHDYITVEGKKMSKTVGNVLDPLPLIEKYGADALRYYLLAKISPFSDGDFSIKNFEETYNADLANGLGNLVARVAKLAEKNEVTVSPTEPQIPRSSETGGYTDHLKNYEFNLALEEIWKEIKKLDVEINTTQPWSLSKDEATPHLQEYIRQIKNIAHALTPFMPETAEKIKTQFKGPHITSTSGIFPRITIK